VSTFGLGILCGLAIPFIIESLWRAKMRGKKASERWQCRRCLRTFLWGNKHVRMVQLGRNDGKVMDCCPTCGSVQIEKV